jgi:TonB family protein
METIGLYLLKSAAWLTGFALVYLLVLRNEHFFRLNRIFLLTGIAASLLFPFYTFHYAVVLPALTSGTTSVGAFSAGAVVPEQPTTFPVYFWIYLIGSLAFLLRLLFQTWKIIRKLRETGYERTGIVKLVRTPEYASSFSFFSFVFVNPSIAKIEMEEIMNHEREHIQQRHWFDLLLVEMVCIAQWFNPFAWIYAHLVRQNHEFLADESALQRTADPAVYQATLLNQLLGVPVFSLTNSFSYSLNKQRFKMMKKKIDSPFRKLKMLVVLPLAAMLFYAFATPDYRFASDNPTSATEGKTVDVTGQVLKSDGTPLSGTTVILKGSTTGTITDKEGNFLFKGIPANGELVFSFVGFESKVQKVTGQPMKVTMEPVTVGIEKVTVVGYGTPPPIPPPPVSAIASKIDAANPPLIYLDGVQIDQEAMGRIDPNTIQSMSVLKDKKSNDEYEKIVANGVVPKNGVILITTKAKAAKDLNKSGVYSDQKQVPPPPPPPQPSGLSRKLDGPNPPLIYLDGVLIDKKTLHQFIQDNLVNIQEIEGQAALDKYGEKGKNGVISVTSRGPAPKEANPFAVYSDHEAVKNEIENNVFLVVEEMPEFPGGELALRKFIGETIQYPAEAKAKGIQGKVFVTFVVNSTGKVEKAKIARGVDPLLDAEALRVVGALPTWKPGKQRGVAVSVSYTVPVSFALSDKKETSVAQETASPKGKKEVFIVVEEMPEFPGGAAALRQFIASSVSYPVEAQEAKAQGKVYVTFVVNSNGKIENPKIARSVSPALDAEALRVISGLPEWKPGRQHGQAVSVAYTMPIEFVLK